MTPLIKVPRCGGYDEGVLLAASVKEGTYTPTDAERHDDPLRRAPP